MYIGAVAILWWSTKLCIAYWHIICRRYRCDVDKSTTISVIVELSNAGTPSHLVGLHHFECLTKCSCHRSGWEDAKWKKMKEMKHSVLFSLFFFIVFFIASVFFLVSPFSKVNILRHILALADFMQRLGTRWSRSNCRSSSLADSPSATTQDDQPFFLFDASWRCFKLYLSFVEELLDIRHLTSMVSWLPAFGFAVNGTSLALPVAERWQPLFWSSSWCSHCRQRTSAQSHLAPSQAVRQQTQQTALQNQSGTTPLWLNKIGIECGKRALLWVYFTVYIYIHIHTIYIQYTYIYIHIHTYTYIHIHICGTCM